MPTDHFLPIFFFFFFFFFFFLVMCFVSLRLTFNQFESQRIVEGQSIAKCYKGEDRGIAIRFLVA